METKQCLIVGLPDAGKSTYIGAFWAIEKDGKTNHKLTCIEYPNDTSYLDALKSHWLHQQIVSRTPLIAPEEISLKLHSNDLNENLELHIPDFKGELFQNVLINNVSKKLLEWLEKAECVLYFLQKTDSDIFEEEIHNKTKDEDKANFDKRIMQVTDMSYWIKNIMLLKYLSRKKGNDIKITICISSWDKVIDGDAKSVEEWVQTNEPFFYLFVKNHFKKVKFYGISAQGLDYDKRSDTKTFDAVQELTDKGQRAYVYTTKKSYDITEPLASLLHD